jgi:hypothetical protein
MRSENISLFTQHLLAIMSSEVSHLVGMAVICCWQNFPEDFSDISPDEPHPFDVVGREVIDALMDFSYAQMKAGNPSMRHLFATLFARLAAIRMHPSDDRQVVPQLAQDVLDASDIAAMLPVSIALQKICSSCELEDDELTPLYRAIFTGLETTDSARIANELTMILSVIAHEAHELLEDGDASSALVQALLHLGSVAETQEAALTCWNQLWKIDHEFVGGRFTELIDQALAVLVGDSPPGALLAALSLVKRLAKFEDEMEDACDVIRGSSDAVIAALVRVVGMVPGQECDESETWAPFIAAKRALRRVVFLLEDDALAPVSARAVEMIASDEYAAQYAGLTLLDVVISWADSPKLIGDVFQSILARTESEAPRVRRAAVKALRNGFHRIVRDSPDFPAALELASAAFELMPMLGDDPMVAYEAAHLLAILTRVPGFSQSGAVLEALVRQAFEARASFGRNPTAHITYVVEGADSAVVAPFFGHFVALLRKAVSEPSLLGFVSDTCEIIRFYFLRFQGELAAALEDLPDALVHLAHLPHECASDALVPLGMLAHFCREQAIPLVDTMVDILHTALAEVGDPIACFNAAESLRWLDGLDLAAVAPALMDLLLTVLEYDTQLPMTRHAALEAITMLIGKYPDPLTAVVGRVFAYVSFFLGLKGLDLLLDEDQKEAQLTALAIGNFLCQAIAIESTEEMVLASLALIVTVVTSCDVVIKGLAQCLLRLIERLAGVAREDVIEMIQRAEEVVQFILEQVRVEGHKDIGTRILGALGFQEGA